MFVISLCADQEDNVHMRIQLTMNLSSLDKIILCQSFHEGNAIHLDPIPMSSSWCGTISR